MLSQTTTSHFRLLADDRLSRFSIQPLYVIHPLIGLGQSIRTYASYTPYYLLGQYILIFFSSFHMALHVQYISFLTRVIKYKHQKLCKENDEHVKHVRQFLMTLSLVHLAFQKVLLVR